MKICYLVYIRNETIRRMIKWIGSRGHEVYIVSPAPPPEDLMRYAKELGNVYFYKSYLNIDIPFSSLWSRILSPIKIIRKINPDLIHVQDITGFVIPIVLFKNYPKITTLLGGGDIIAELPDIPLGLKIIGIKIILPSKWLHRLIYRLILRIIFENMNKVHCVSENLYELSSFYCRDKDKKKIVTLPPGVDTKIYNIYVNGLDIKKLFGWENNIIVISIRSIEPVYNVECLIEAIPQVIREIPETRFIIKTGQACDASLLIKLKNRVKEMKLQDYVKFIGYIKYEELPKYLACADVYVSTSLFDGLGISNLEAVSCGTPAVLADIDSTRNLIKKGLYARLYPPKDSKALAKEIIASIKNKEKENKEIHKRNFEIIKEHYDFDKNMEKMEQLYKDLIDKYKRKT